MEVDHKFYAAEVPRIGITNRQNLTFMPPVLKFLNEALDIQKFPGFSPYLFTRVVPLEKDYIINAQQNYFVYMFSKTDNQPLVRAHLDVYEEKVRISHKDKQPRLPITIIIPPITNQSAQIIITYQPWKMPEMVFKTVVGIRNLYEITKYEKAHTDFESAQVAQVSSFRTLLVKPTYVQVAAESFAGGEELQFIKTFQQKNGLTRKPLAHPDPFAIVQQNQTHSRMLFGSSTTFKPRLGYDPLKPYQLPNTCTGFGWSGFCGKANLGELLNITVKITLSKEYTIALDYQEENQSDIYILDVTTNRHFDRDLIIHHFDMKLIVRGYSSTSPTGLFIIDGRKQIEKRYLYSIIKIVVL